MKIFAKDSGRELTLPLLSSHEIGEASRRIGSAKRSFRLRISAQNQDEFDYCESHLRGDLVRMEESEINPGAINLKFEIAEIKLETQFFDDCGAASGIFEIEVRECESVAAVNDRPMLNTEVAITDSHQKLA